MIWSDFEFVIHLACIIKPRILDIIWPCLLIIMIMTWLFSGILFICALVVSFAALALRARAANDTTRAQINNIPSKSHVIPLLSYTTVTTELQAEFWLQYEERVEHSTDQVYEDLNASMRVIKYRWKMSKDYFKNKGRSGNHCFQRHASWFGLVSDCLLVSWLGTTRSSGKLGKRYPL